VSSTQTSDVPQLALFFTVNLYMSRGGGCFCPRPGVTGERVKLSKKGDLFREKGLAALHASRPEVPDEAQAGSWLLAPGIGRCPGCSVPPAWGRSRSKRPLSRSLPARGPARGTTKRLSHGRAGGHRDLLTPGTSLRL